MSEYHRLCVLDLLNLLLVMYRTILKLFMFSTKNSIKLDNLGVSKAKHGLVSNLL